MIERCTYCGEEHEVTTIKLPSGIAKTCPNLRDDGSLFGMAIDLTPSLTWPPKIDDETRGKWERNDYASKGDDHE